MSKSKQIKAITDRKSNQQTTILNDFGQLRNVVTETPYSQMSSELSEYQNFLYRRALYGLKIYEPEEINQMHWQKRKRITKVHKRTQMLLNKIKQTKLINTTNSIFSIFHKSVLAKEIIDNNSTTDPEFVCTIPFKDINITKNDIIEELIKNGLLPYNFRKIS